MNKERYNQIIDEAYRNYAMSCIKETKKQEREMKEKGGWNTLCLEPYFESKEKFIGLIKTDSEFSEKWGLKIEERELSLEEKCRLANFAPFDDRFPVDDSAFKWNEHTIKTANEWLEQHHPNIPNKLITITYNNEKIEVYE